jgi:hypothetical protein
MRGIGIKTQEWRFSSRRQAGGWMSFVRRLLIVALVVSLFPAVTSTVSADTGEAYLDQNGELQINDNVTVINSSNFGDYSTLTNGWYLFKGSWNQNSTITVSGDVYIILEDDSRVVGSAGINVSVGNSLTIYAQSTGSSMGILGATGGSNNAGIGGGNLGASGAITINGGDITATGGFRGAGIGGGYGGAGGTITINGGDITATGGDVGAGIGGGHNGAGGMITINGGDITATGGFSGAGIGGGEFGAGGTITIHGGGITATGGDSGAGIGGGYGGDGGTITIHGGDITATGRQGGAGIGGGHGGPGGKITIHGGDITATGGGNGAKGIGGGNFGTDGTIMVSGSYEYWTNTTNSAPGAMTGSGSFDRDTSTFAGSIGYVKLRSVEFITSAVITVTAPVTGATPSTSADVDTANFTLGTVTWNPVATTFAGNTSYTATVTLTAESGYAFATTLTTATINGNTATVTNITGTTVTLSYAFAATATEINSAAITVTAPVTGATPSTSADVDTANFTLGTVTWNPTATTFAGSTEYTATVTLTVYSGYVFASTLTTAMINGNTATVTNNTGTTVTLSYAFAATAVPGGGDGGNTSIPPSTPPESQPEPTPEPTQQPMVEVFNSNIVNSASLVEKLAAQVAAAKKANTMMDFADTHGHWAKQSIDTFLKMQLISGYEDGTFRPNGNVTRAEFATMLSRAFNIQVGNSTNITFKDLDKHWAKDVIVSLAAAGVIQGYEDGTFMPEQTITREEMVIMLSRIVNLNNVAKDTSKGHFTDLSRSYVASEIQTAAQAGIVNGKGNDRFDPKGNATRAEALEIILNALNLDPQVKSLLDSLS